MAGLFNLRTFLIGGGGHKFGAHGGNRPQQELGEMAEGGGFLARDAPLREQAKNLTERAVYAGGGREVAAGGIEFGKIECATDDVTSGCRVAEQLVFSFGVEAAEGGMNIGARHSALAAIGKFELATVWQGFRRDPSLRFVARDDHPGWMVELATLGQWVGVYLHRARV